MSYLWVTKGSHDRRWDRQMPIDSREGQLRPAGQKAKEEEDVPMTVLDIWAASPQEVIANLTPMQITSNSHQGIPSNITVHWKQFKSKPKASTRIQGKIQQVDPLTEGKGENRASVRIYSWAHHGSMHILEVQHQNTGKGWEPMPQPTRCPWTPSTSGHSMSLNLQSAKRNRTGRPCIPRATSKENMAEAITRCGDKARPGHRDCLRRHYKNSRPVQWRKSTQDSR